MRIFLNDLKISFIEKSVIFELHKMHTHLHTLAHTHTLSRTRTHSWKGNGGDEVEREFTLPHAKLYV